MEKYIIVLGSNWKLALAELEQLLRLKEYKGYVTDYSANCAIVEFDESQLGSDVDPLEMIGNLMVRLGCSQKIAKMIDFIDITLLNDAFPAEITMDNRTEVFTGRDYISGMLDDLIFNLFGDKDEINDAPKKGIRKGIRPEFFFANSIYPFAFKDEYYKTLVHHFLPYLNTELYTKLKGIGAKKVTYFKYPEEKMEDATLNPIFPHHFFQYELYEPNRVELIYALTDEGMYIGHTQTVVDSNFQKMLDVERPHLDFKRSIPPKYAKGLLSFLQLEGPLHTKKVLDPFCGVGTMLQFGYMLGYNIYGADINADHVKYSQENLIYTAQVLNSQGADTPLTKNKKKELLRHVVQSDISELSSKFTAKSFDGIATEPMLIPFFKQLPDDNELRTLFEDEVIKNYTHLVKHSYDLLKENVGARLAVVSPIIFRRFNKFDVPMQEIAEDIGFKIIRLLDSNRIYDSQHEEFQISTQTHYSILDTRSKRIGREFFVFEK